MPGNEEIPRNFNAPEILAALKQLQVDLAATRADIRTVADRQSVGRSGAAAGGEPVGTAGEVQGTTAALGDEATARRRNISLAEGELAIQREITAAVAQTALSYAKLTETRGGASAMAVPAAASTASAAETRAVLATQRMQPPVPMMAPVVQERVPPTAALGSYSQELTNVSARQAEFTAVQMQGGAANSQFIQNLARGDVTLSEFGSQLGSTVGKFAQWTAAAAGIFAVIGLFTELYKGAKESSSGVDQLKRSIDGLDTEKAAVEIRNLAHGLNIPIDEASEAIFKFSRTFPTLDNAVAAARVGLSALKVDTVALTESVPALTQVHQQFGVSAQGLGTFFDTLDEAQRRYNARVGVTLAATQKSAAAMKDAGATLEQLVQIETYAARVTGQPGAQIGTALYRAASNFVQQPKAQSQIQALGLDPHEASTEIGKFMLNAIKVAQDKSPQWRRELAIAIGGKQQGGKVFEPLLSGTDPKLLAEITTGPHAITPDKAKGSTQQELLDILEKPSERVKALKLDLEQLGGALQSAGGLAGPGVFLVGLTDSLNVVKQLLEGFNMLPHPVKELLTTLLEVSLVMKVLRSTALGTGLANATGLGFLGPSQASQASRAERAAQESSLAGVQGMQGSTIAREQALRTQAVINETQIKQLQLQSAEAVTLEERAVIQAQIDGLTAANLEYSQEGNLLLTEQAAQQEVANGLQLRINALRAGAMPAAGFFPAAAGGAGAGAAGAAGIGEAEAVAGGGLMAKLSGALPALMKAGMVGIMADVGTQIASQVIPGSIGKQVGGLGTDVGIGAAAGSVVPGVGTAAGALTGAMVGLAKEINISGNNKPLGAFSFDNLGKGILDVINSPITSVKGRTAGPSQDELLTKSFEAKIKKAYEAEGPSDSSMASLKAHLGPEVLKAQAGELSPERLKEIQATLSAMLNDPGFVKFSGALKEMQTQLAEVSKGTTEASRALAQTKQFGRYGNIAGMTAPQIAGNADVAALSATTIGASKGNVVSLTHDFAQMAAQYGGGGGKEELTKFKEVETKVLEAAKKNAEDLAGKAKVDSSISGKTTDYKAAIAGIDAWTSSVQKNYQDLAKQLKGEEAALKKAQADQASENAANQAHPGTITSTQMMKRDKQIAELEEGVKNNRTEAGRLKKATEYETNQLKAARQAAAEGAFTDISNAIDAKSGLAEAKTTDKSVQLADVLKADNEKLKLALELFGKNSTQYEKALTEVLKEQQAIVEQAVTNLDVAGKLSASRVSGTGANQDIQRAQINLGAQRQELSALQAGGAEPNKIKAMETQINEAENALGKNMLARAKTITDANAQIKAAGVQDPIAKARIELQAAMADEKGLSGPELLQQQATVAQKKADIANLVTNERIAQLKSEYSLEKISANAEIDGLKQILATRKLSAAEKRSIQEQIFQLQKGAASGLELNVGSIKLPTIYEIRRAVAGGKAGMSGSMSVTNNNEIKIDVSKNGDEHKVYKAIDKVLNTNSNAAARAAGKV
jgi:hypothetical protein